MEFVHSLKPRDINETDLHNQNTDTDANCYFENRLQEPISDLYIPITQQRDSYSNNYTSPSQVTNLPSNNEPINNNIPSHYKILIDNITETNEPNLQDISQSYNTSNNEVNFNFKDYNGTMYDIDESNLLSKNKYQINNSVTENQIYTNTDFWTQQVPKIITNEYIVRDAARYNYDSSFERFQLPKYTGGKYNLSPRTENFDEPKVSNNYISNYTSDNNLIIHEGQKKPTHMNKYKKNENYSRGNDGMLVYYEDNKDIYYKNQFNIEEDKKEILDPNGNKYNKFMNVNEKDPTISDYEKNIMLRRNDNILASMNYTMRYD